MTTQYPEECITVKRFVDDEQYAEAVKKHKTEKTFLLKIDATPFRFKEANQGYTLGIGFYNNCRQTVTKRGKEVEIKKG